MCAWPRTVRSAKKSPFGYWRSVDAEFAVLTEPVITEPGKPRSKSKGGVYVMPRFAEVCCTPAPGRAARGAGELTSRILVWFLLALA
jgi:hypothetical protein